MSEPHLAKKSCVNLQHQAQNAVLWRAGVAGLGGGSVSANSYMLAFVVEETQDPVAQGGTRSHI